MQHKEVFGAAGQFLKVDVDYLTLLRMIDTFSTRLTNGSYLSKRAQSSDAGLPRGLPALIGLPYLSDNSAAPPVLTDLQNLGYLRYLRFVPKGRYGALGTYLPILPHGVQWYGTVCPPPPPLLGSGRLLWKSPAVGSIGSTLPAVPA